MKTVQLICPKWSLTMPWINGFKKILGEEYKLQFLEEPKISEKPSAIIYLWCDAVAKKFINGFKVEGCKQIVFIRRYDYFTGDWSFLKWANVEAVFFVNNVFRTEFENWFKQQKREKEIEGKVHTIYNVVDKDKFPFKRREHGKQVGMVGFLKFIKNIPLALQIMEKLPRDYTLNLLGQLVNTELMYYLHYFCMKTGVKVIVHEPIGYDGVPKFLKNIDYLLSCSTSEGNPNSVNEAMMTGIKPVIHAWPGATVQYKDNTFVTLDEAVKQILPESEYSSLKYRQIAEEKFSYDNLKAVKALLT